jgi:hypothetical protein
MNSGVFTYMNTPIAGYWLLVACCWLLVIANYEL